MVGLFMVIGVVCRLRAGAPEPPDGVASGHEAREAVTSHSRERYARIAPRERRADRALRVTRARAALGARTGYRDTGEGATSEGITRKKDRKNLRYVLLLILRITTSNDRPTVTELLHVLQVILKIHYEQKACLKRIQYHNRISQKRWQAKLPQWTAAAYVTLNYLRM